LKKKVLNILVLIIASLTLWQCSTKKAGFTHRLYHNTTSRYNGWFNANEILKESEEKIWEAHQEDYSELLPIFVYGDEETAKNLYPDMDKIIDKCSNVIEFHSIYIRKKEYNKWIDNCYLLIGKARFYKQEYFRALEIFKYVAKAFPARPEYYEALLWQVKNYMALGDLQKAEKLLEKLEKAHDVPEDLRAEIFAQLADFYIKKADYPLAAHYLTKAITHTKNKDKRSRLTYILAQLYLKQNDYKNASHYFAQVIKMKPPYELFFNAQISRALAYDVNSKNKDEVKKMLEKMLKDDKNIEYRDQIYYALADIAFKEWKDDLAVEYLKKSVSSSVKNTKQKALSYMRLADYYFEKPNYILAEAYYDSTLQFLPKEHKNYLTVYDKHEGLKDLVENLKIIQTQDSLLTLANMPEDERNKIIQSLIDKAKEEEERKKEQLANIQNNNTDNTNFNTPNINNSNGEWYFYNPTTMAFGVNEFKKIWGDRKLEDNWRRSNKQSLAEFIEENDIDTIENDTIVNPKFSPQYYLNNIPLTKEKQMQAHAQKIEAHYNAATILKEHFEDFDNSIANYNEIINNYDTSFYFLPSLYAEYRIYLAQNDEQNARRIKEIILNKYPDSEYARIISDPIYMKIAREERKKAEDYYERAYDLYKNKNYNIVILRCEKSKSIFAENHIQDKFDLLKALAIGQTSPRDTFKVALEYVIQQHPNTESAKKAQEILNMIKKEMSTPPDKFPTVEYSTDKNTPHLFVLVVPITDKLKNQYKSIISDFNTKYFSEKNLKVESMFIDANNELITVKEFPTAAEAINYYQTFKLNNNELRDLLQKNYPLFIISTQNFPKYYKDKNTSLYLNFFQSTYLKEQ
jgi:tetratricopeptide (TPR) repeat protein